MAAGYKQQTGIKLDTYETTIVDGVGPVRL
jgi:hypothetical protein